MTEWAVEHNDDGLYDVRRDGKAFAYDLDDLDTALEEVRSAYRRGDEVSFTDTTGYTIPVDL